MKTIYPEAKLAIAILLAMAVISGIVAIGDAVTKQDYSAFWFPGICATLALVVYLLSKFGKTK